MGMVRFIVMCLLALIYGVQAEAQGVPNVTEDGVIQALDEQETDVASIWQRLEEATGGPERLVPAYCCRYCSVGKPCGNSCINRSYTCRQPSGCAC
jgi:hypothetical protein